MFIGHYAVALAAKKASPRTSLGTLFIAAQLVDLIWPVLLLLGVEHVRIDPGNTAFTPFDFYDYPITHSLAGAALWALIMGIMYRVIRRDLRGGLVVAACVFSHWILDFITHRPDLPLWFTGSTRLGAGLWNSVGGTLVVECAMFGAGLALYVRATRPRDRTGTYAFWALIVCVCAIYSANVVAPPPTDAGMVAVAGNAAWLFVIWAFWADRHRVVEGGVPPASAAAPLDRRG